MGRENSVTPGYEIVALVTLKKERILGGKQLSILAENADEQKNMTEDLAKALNADVVKLTNGDYIVLRQ